MTEGVLLAYFVLIASLGLVYAQHNLSLLYLAGRGSEQNYKLAYQYAVLASDQGFIPATVRVSIWPIVSMD